MSVNLYSTNIINIIIYIKKLFYKIKSYLIKFFMNIVKKVIFNKKTIKHI